MKNWLVVIDFKLPQPYQRLVDIQACFDDGQVNLIGCETGMAIVVRAPTPPDTSKLKFAAEHTPNIFVAELAGLAQVSGDAEFLSGWLGQITPSTSKSG